MALINRGKLRDLRYLILRVAARCGIAAASVLPRRIGLAFFGAMGAVAYRVPHPDRERTLRHLKLIFGSTWDGGRIRKTAGRVYRELGKNLFDAIYLPRLAPENYNAIVTHDPFDAIKAEYDKGKGCISITAHTGCFEMLLHMFPMNGYKCFAVGKKMHDEGLDRIIRSIRSGDDIVYMDRSEGARKVVRHLQEGRIFGVLIDQDTAVEGVFADFLGKPAYTPSGPVKMAMRMNLPLFVTTAARQKDDTHHVFITGPLDLRRSNDFEKDLVYNITMINRIICDTIRRYPEQWVWMHNRWRRQPSAGQLRLMADVA
ncbi:MAG: lysophospholipid acyltransferase family protein [Chitinispirillaceae bacterium]|nr:lysophospholipid acyltransferase family protein [Chitinispirillaceae bacterium]